MRVAFLSAIAFLCVAPFAAFLWHIGVLPSSNAVLAFLEAHNGAITALATAVVAIFTLSLWASTYGLWKEAKAAGETARRSADAAVLSADAAIKASMPVLFPYITDMVRLHPVTPIKADIEHDANIFIGFDNYGKTPGIVREVRAALFLTVADALPDVNPDKLPEYAYPVWIAGEARGKDLSTGALDMKQRVRFTPRELDELLAEAATKNYRRFALIGQVIYDDLFGNRHTSRFCLKLRLMFTNPQIHLQGGTPQFEGGQFHMFQVAQGGSRYNNITTERIPQQD